VFDGRAFGWGISVTLGRRVGYGARGGVRALLDREDPGLYRPAEGVLAPALVEQLARAAQQGDPPPDRRRRHLPRPSFDRPPGGVRCSPSSTSSGPSPARYMSAESIAKALTDPAPNVEEVKAIAPAASRSGEYDPRPRTPLDGT
jgi:hypothetical protein